MELTFTVLNISTWWSSLDVNYQTVLISSFVSLIILLLGFIISERNRQRTKSRELTQYKQFIEEWVAESRKTLDQYISSLEKFSDEIKSNKSLNIPKWTSNLIDCSEINKIPLERYADIYIFGIDSNDYEERRKQLMNFLHQLEYLEKAPSLIMDIYNDYSKQNKDIMGEWNNCYMTLNMLYSKINYEDNPEAEPYYSYLKNAIDNSSKFSNLDIWTLEYIQPTLNKITEAAPSPESILFQIAIYTKDLENVILKHYNLNKYSELFSDYAANFKKSRDIIDNFMSYFENKKIKRYCK